MNTVAMLLLAVWLLAVGPQDHIKPERERAKAPEPARANKFDRKAASGNHDVQTAYGAKADRYGNKLGPSGKPMIHIAEHSRQKRASDAAGPEGYSAPVKHASPARGDPHYHATDRNGAKIPNSTHHTYSK